MALLAIRKTGCFPPPRCFSPFHNLIPCLLSLPTNSSPNPKHRFSTVTSQGFHYNSIQVARDLFALFSKPPNLRTDDELRSLGRKLTPEAVETVLKDLKGWHRAHEFFRWVSRQDGFRHNCYTYNAMASILSRARRKGLLRTLAFEVLNRRCPMTPGALGFFIRCLGDQGLVDEANHMFDHAESLHCAPNAYTYNCLLEVLAKLGKVDLVESRLSEMLGLEMELDKYTLTPILKVYCNAGKFDDAMVVFNRIYGKGWADEHVFTTLLVSFCKFGEVDRTCELIERMEGLKMRLNDKTLCVLIHGFVKEGRVDKALVMFEKTKESGSNWDLALYSVLIDGLCEGRDLRKALDFYLEMKDNGIFPDIRLVTRMISKFCGEGDLVTANQLLEEDGKKFDFGSLVLLYNAVLDGLVSHGDVEGAHSLVRVMMESQDSQAAQKTLDECGGSDSVVGAFRIKKAVCPNHDSFNIVVCGLCKAQKLEMALELINDMVGIGCTGKLLMYNNLISELCNVNRLDESLELLRKMKEFGFEPTQFTHNSIFGCLCKRKDLPAAVDMLREMRRHGHVPWIKHCTLLVQQLCRHGKVEEACKFLDDMVEVGFLPDMIAYSAAIDGLCRIGNVDQALKVFRDVSANWYLPDVVAHNILINGFCNAGRLMEAQDIMKEMLEKGLVPSVVTYNLMMNAWCKDDSIDVALLCFSKMIDEEARLPTVVTYTILINGFFNAGRPDDALAYWNNMREKGCAQNKIAYTALIHGLCKCGREDTALVYFHEMEEREFEPDISVYLMLLNALTLKGNPLSAFELLKEMVQKVNFPSPVGKNYQLLKDAVYKLYEDVHTSSYVTKIIEEGGIPGIHSVDILGENMKKS